MTQLTKADQFIRSTSEDRPLLSANDWWGAGFLHGMDASVIEAKKIVRWYCGKNGAYEQFNQGHAWALLLQRTSL